jgi:4-hydroxybenzoate polyprenyltransferase
MSGAMPWLRLLRLPNVCTVVADVSMGYLIADGGARRPAIWLLLVTASSALYLAGVVLNDVFDYRLDQHERPERPLPAGQIRRSAAASVGAGLLVLGVASAFCVGQFSQAVVPAVVSSGVIGTVLAICILLYDGLAKATWLGPLLMGACRGFNVLLGVHVTQDAAVWQSPGARWIPLGIAVYVFGITWFARHETARSPRTPLWMGIGGMALGVVMVAMAPLSGMFPATRNQVALPFEQWWLLFGLITCPVWYRCGMALQDPQPPKVQAVIRRALLTLIALDAAVALAVAGPAYAIAIVLLLVPATLLARWIAMT